MYWQTTPIRGRRENWWEQHEDEFRDLGPNARDLVDRSRSNTFCLAAEWIVLKPNLSTELSSITQRHTFYMWAHSFVHRWLQTDASNRSFWFRALSDVTAPLNLIGGSGIGAVDVLERLDTGLEWTEAMRQDFVKTMTIGNLHLFRGNLAAIREIRRSGAFAMVEETSTLPNGQTVTAFEFDVRSVMIEQAWLHEIWISSRPLESTLLGGSFLAALPFSSSYETTQWAKTVLGTWPWLGSYSQRCAIGVAAVMMLHGFDQPDFEKQWELIDAAIRAKDGGGFVPSRFVGTVEKDILPRPRTIAPGRSAVGRGVPQRPPLARPDPRR